MLDWEARITLACSAQENTALGVPLAYVHLGTGIDLQPEFSSRLADLC